MKNKKVLIPVIVLVFAAVAGGLFMYKNRQSSTTPGTVTNPPGTEKLDLSPATEDDQKQADERKEQLADQEEQNQTPPTNQKVTPVIISASATSVRGFVPGIYESGGTCTATFTKDGKTVTKQSAATKGATTTDCTPISLTKADFPATGEWTVVLSYKSSTAEGSSASQKVTIN